MNERRSYTGAEDMLASIRRLVADEVRAGGEVMQGSARLLLTPSLRVDPGQFPPKRSEKIRPLRTVLNERRAALAARGGMMPLLLTEDFAVSPEQMALERAERAAESQPSPAPLRLVQSQPAEQPAQAPTETPDFLARLAELESLLDARDQSYDVEEPQFDEEIGSWLTSHAGALSGVPFIDLGLGAREELAARDKIDPPEEELMPAPQAEPAPDNAPAEDAQLRALIRDVLRDELEGPMGERVTRNLRKLIRSELARALAARGLG